MKSERYEKFMNDLCMCIDYSYQAHDYSEISHLDLLLFEMKYVDFQSEDEKKQVRASIENAIDRVSKNMRNSNTYKTYGTTLYRHAFNNQEIKFVEFLSKITDKETLFAKVRKRVAKITSDRVIGRYQTLTEMRYVELGGRL